MKLYPLLKICIVISLGLPSQVSAARRALMIGISDYVGLPSLVNPRIDIDKASVKLRQAQFEVTSLSAQSNTRQKLLEGLDKFINTIDENDTVLIYYSGHGVDVKGNNQLVRSDAPRPGTVSNDAVLANYLIPFHDLMVEIEDRAPAVQIWIIDACRNNPYSDPTKGRAPQGLAPTPPAQGTYVLYSAAYNQASIDRLITESPSQKLGSPFSRTFVSLFDKGKSKDIDLFRRDISGELGKLVSPQAQYPTAENGMNGEWCFATCSSGVQQVAVSAQRQKLDSNEARLAIKNANGLTTINYHGGTAATAVASNLQLDSNINPVLNVVSEQRGVVFIGKRSVVRCPLKLSDSYPLGCSTLQTIAKHFDDDSTDPLSGLVGQNVIATTPLNIRRGLPQPGGGGTKYGCRVRVLKTGESVKIASTVALTYAGDTFYWGVIDGPPVSCAPNNIPAPPAAT